MSRTFWVSINSVTGVHGAEVEALANIYSDPGSGASVLTATVPANTSGYLSHAFYTASGYPGSADWPVASAGDPYTLSINVQAAGADLTYGLVSNGHFAVVNSGTSSDSQTRSVGIPTSGTGVKTFSDTSWNPTSGNTSDRFEAVLNASNSSMHSDETLSIYYNNSSTYLKGPWLQVESPALLGGATLYAPIVNPPDFPFIKARASWKDSGSGTSQTVSLTGLGTIASGDLIVAECYFPVDCTYNTPTGYTQANGSGDGSNWRRSVFYKTASGGETSFQVTGISPSSNLGVVLTLVKAGTHNDVVEAGNVASGTSTSPNPPSLTPSWGSDNTLWLASTGWTGIGVVTGYPSGFSGPQADLVGTARFNGVVRWYAGSPLDPSAYSIDATGAWVASTTAVQPVSTGAQTVSNPALLGGATLYAPTVVPDQFVTSPALLGGATLHAPSVAQKVVMTAVLGVSSLFSPQVNQQVSSPALLGGATLYGPTVLSAQTVSDPALLGGATQYAPQVNQSVAAPALLGPASIYAPQVNQSVADPALLGPAQIYDPTVQPGNFTVADPALLGPASLFSPTIEQKVALGVLGGATLYAPQVNQSVSAPALLGPAQIYSPAVGTIVSDPALQGPAVLYAPTIQPGGVTVSDPALLGGASLYDPTASHVGGGPQTVSDPALLGPAVLLGPTVNQSVLAPSLLGGATIYAPSVIQQVAPGALGGASLYAPTVQPGGVTVSDPALLGGAVLYAPTASVGATFVSDPALLGPAALYAPTVNQQAVPGLLGPAVLYGPQIQQQVANPALLGGANTFAPSVVQWVAPGLLGGASLYSPTLLQEQIISDMAVLGGALLYNPDVLLQLQYVTPDPLGPAVLYAPAVQGIDMPVPLGPAVLYAPDNILQVVSAPALLGGATIYTPSVGLSVAPVTLGGSTLFTPTAVHTGPQSVSPSLLGGATIFAPAVMGIDMPEPLGPATLYEPVIATDQPGFNEQTRQNDPPTRIPKYEG